MGFIYVLQDIYGMQTSGFSGLNEEDLDLDFVTLEGDEYSLPMIAMI